MAYQTRSRFISRGIVTGGVALAFSFLAFSARAQSTPVDYSSYEIAKKYKQDNNILFAYKHLLIFKYTNQKKLQEPQNQAALKQVDGSLKELEEVLKQSYAWYDIKKSRGFSDRQLDSALRISGNAVTLLPLKIN